MALEGANIIGQAQVYNQTQNAVNQYARTLQQQQLQRERESKALSDELSKVKVDGIRQPDIPKFTNKYQLLKDLSAKKSATRDNAEKIKLDREISTTWLELNQMGELSRNNARSDYQFAGKLLDPNIRRGYKKEAVTQFQQSMNLPSDDPRYISDKTTLEHQIDLSKTIKRISDIGDASLKEARYTQESAPETRGNVVGTNVGNVRRSDQQKLSDAIETEMLDDNFSTAVGQMFPNTTYEQQVAELIRMGSKAQYGESKFFPNKDDWKEKALFNHNLAMKRKAMGDTNPNDFIPKTVEFFTKAKPLLNAKGENILNKEGIEVMGTSKFSQAMVNATTPKSTSFPSTYIKQAFNLDENRNQPLEARQDLKLAKIGWVLTSSGKYEFKAAVVDKDDVTYLIEEFEVPVDVRNTNNYRAARQASGSKPSAPAKQTKKAEGGYKIGQVDSGYKYMGGDPSKQENWVKQ